MSWDDDTRDHDEQEWRQDDDVLDELVARADLDGLVRLVDSRCASRDWQGLLLLRDRSRAAVATGRQLWPAATLAEYRLALLAPPEWAATVVDEDSGRFTIGPLTEVVAQHHTFADLAPHLPVGPRAAFVAHERVLRGETLHSEDTDRLDDVLELPYELQAWEPDYLLAEYGDGEVTAAAPDLPSARSFVNARIPTRPAAALDRSDVAPVREALRQLVEPWTVSSNGRAAVAGADGGPGEALQALGLTEARLAPIDPSTAVAWLAWAGASGGAHARRRGTAVGRFGAWWTLAAITGVDVPDDGRLADIADDLGEAIAAWQWWWFDTGTPGGWSLQLVAVDPEDDVAFALLAHDQT